jgi:AraC-like DNA-binding protein
VSNDNNIVMVSLATDDLPERDRVAFWREHFCQTAFGVEIEPQTDAPFRACMSSTAIPGLQLIQGTMSPAVVSRTAAHIADGNTDLALIVNRAGRATVQGRGRELTLQEGDAVLMSGAEVATFTRSTPGASTSLRLSYPMVASMVPNLEDAVMSRIPEHNHALRVLTGYLNSVQEGTFPGTPELRQLVVSHVYDLVALALGSSRDAEAAANARGVRAVRLERAKAFIVDNISRPDLSVALTAAHVGVRARYLQKLFEEEGSTFSKFVLDKRLDRAHRMLSEPTFSARAVNAIAYDVGFGDLSYFHRRFRRLYGVTPLGIRRAARHSLMQA